METWEELEELKKLGEDGIKKRLKGVKKERIIELLAWQIGRPQGPRHSGYGTRL
jgi:hypothetical protein